MTRTANIKAGRITTGMTFHEKVWAITARIPRGRVATYGSVAQRLGTRAYRAVGQALHHNPHAPDVPCHRVVCRDGQLTGFSRGLAAKQRLLKAEGVCIVAGRVDLNRHQCRL